jgi:drug/metabolite transporter (DMT)-like permease
MIYLFCSIVLSSYLVLALKYVNNKGIATFETIAFNYCTCVIVGSFVNAKVIQPSTIIHQPWFICAVVMGTLFVSIFNLIATTVQKNGVSVASVANKLSLVIPFLFSLYLYHEYAGWTKWIGLSIALIAVWFTCFAAQTGKHKKLSAWVRYGLPSMLFISSGLLDTFINYIEKKYLTDYNKNDFLISTFFVAATISIICVLYRIIIQKRIFSWKPVVAGVLIGIPNYFSIWSLVQVLQKYTAYGATIIPINNMGIVLFSTVTSALMFKEKLSVINWIGILLSIVAIGFMAY